MSSALANFFGILTFYTGIHTSPGYLACLIYVANFRNPIQSQTLILNCEFAHLCKSLSHEAMKGIANKTHEVRPSYEGRV